MRALVLSGGMGLRLRPFSHSMPKQLIPLANKPVLVHVLEGLRSLGVTDIGLVVGERPGKIVERLGDGATLGVRLTYIQQDAPRGLAHCVSIARDFLGDEDFVMYLGDNLLTEGVADMAEEFRARRPAAQLVVHKVADPCAFGVAEVDASGRVLGLVEKPEHPVSDLALVGVYFFTPAIHEAVAAIEAGSRGELEITDAIQWLVASGADVQARAYTGYWKDAGRIEDVLACNRELLDRLRPSVSGAVDADSELIGAVVVEEGARIVRSRITGPAVVGAGTLIEGSTIGPHTSIGEGCVLREVRLSDTIILERATVQGVGPLRGSVIGREATVTAAADGSHRLIVGDHARVEVAA
ncbi:MULTISPECIES: glucose-1-phosphate thymidylyltransferase [unclassified Streptomyces]|uniref:glucose-1-phosphate thymidylyltransferase n=1 Tax=unclassified Streptomyces TaxID=2593676 RepID=UPI003369E226